MFRNWGWRPETALSPWQGSAQDNTASALTTSGECASAGRKVLHMTSRSSTTIVEDLLPLIHPGEILAEEFLEPLGMTQYRLARAIHVPPRRINEIVQGKRAITPDTAMRLARYFGSTPQFWMNLQTGYELRRAERDSGEQIARDVTPLERTG